MADSHLYRWSVSTSEGRDADNRSTQRSGWQSASHPLDRLPGRPLGTKPLQKNCKTIAKSSRLPVDGRLGRRLSNVIFLKDVQSDNPDFMVVAKKTIVIN
jgi:hypothetical protein